MEFLSVVYATGVWSVVSVWDDASVLDPSQHKTHVITSPTGMSNWVYGGAPLNARTIASANLNGQNIWVIGGANQIAYSTDLNGWAGFRTRY